MINTSVMTNKINHGDYAIPLETSLRNQLYDALQGNVVESVMEIARMQSPTNYYRSILEGHSFKVEKKTLPYFYNLFNDIKKTLGFKGKVDFYITGDSSVNAYAISSLNDEEPNIINVNSSLIDLMTEDELRFVVGHEMGHLINGNARLVRLINFVYPGEAEPPITMTYKIRLWEQLNELIADRFGFLAMPKIETCISAFFKMASGLDFEKMKVNIDSFIEENRKRLEYFSKDKGMNYDVHPVNPIRVEALSSFSQSVFFKKNGKPLELLSKETDELIKILLKIRNNEIDTYMADFIASAGVIVAHSDGEASDEEIEAILNNLSTLEVFPANYLSEILKLRGDRLVKKFTKSAQKILELNPNLKQSMMIYLIEIVIADKELKKEEIEMLFAIGENVLGIPPMEAANILLDIIQQNYNPDLQKLF